MDRAGQPEGPDRLGPGTVRQPDGGRTLQVPGEVRPGAPRPRPLRHPAVH